MTQHKPSYLRKIGRNDIACFMLCGSEFDPVGYYRNGKLFCMREFEESPDDQLFQLHYREPQGVKMNECYYLGNPIAGLIWKFGARRKLQLKPLSEFQSDVNNGDVVLLKLAFTGANPVGYFRDGRIHQCDLEQGRSPPDLLLEMMGEFPGGEINRGKFLGIPIESYQVIHRRVNRRTRNFKPLALSDPVEDLLRQYSDMRR